MAAHTRGKVAWDQTSTLGRHSGRVAVGERGRHMKDVDYHRRQLQQQLQALDDEYQRLGNQDDEQAWNLSDEEPRSLQVITQPTPAPGSSSPGTNKRASWAGYDDKAKQNYYGTGPGAVGTMPRTRTSLVDYKMDPADRFKVDIDVKEFNPEDVRIKLEEDGGVCVEAKREDADKSGRLSTLERRSKVKLPHEVDRSRLSAIFSADDGVLTIQAPKRASGTSSPSSLGPQSPNYNIPNSPPGQTILVQPSTPIPPQTDIPYADEPPPSFGQYPMYDSPYNREGSVPVSSPQVIPYYIDRDPPLRQTRSPSPTKRDPIRPSQYQGHPSTSPAYSPRPDHQHNRILYPEPLYTPPRKAHKPQQQQPKTSTPTSNKIILKPAIKESQSPSPRRGRPATEASPASPRSRSSPMPHEKVRSTSLPRQRPAQVQHENISPPEKSDSLPPPMGRMTISFTLGRGFTPDQVIVKNIMNYNKFMVLAKADGYSGRKSFRHIFSWPCPINPATIYAYLKKDGVLHVSSMPLCGPE